MNDGLKAVGFVFGICLLVLVLVFAKTSQWASQKVQVENWAKAHGYTLVGELERPGFLEMSPFWFTDEDDDVYKVILADRDHQKRKSWFRFRAWWGMDQAGKE